MDAKAFLRSIRFFADVLTATELDALAAAARTVKFDAGSDLIHESDPSDSMYVIMQGSVTVRIREKGQDRLVATLGGGDIVGEMSLLTGAPRAATVAAQEPVIALEIDRSAIRPLLRAEPSLFDRLAGMLEKRQTELDKLYGAGLWSLYGPPRTNLAATIRTYFDGLPDHSR